jgi:hypothetical protein
MGIRLMEGLRRRAIGTDFDAAMRRNRGGRPLSNQHIKPAGLPLALALSASMLRLC